MLAKCICTVVFLITLFNGSSAQTNGNWGDWGAWGACTVTCLNGTTTRTRACDDPAPSGGGAACVGNSDESTTCIVMNYCLPSVYGNTDNGACTFPDEFACATGLVGCINITLKCDGNVDCEDGSDENPYFTDCKDVVCFSGTCGLHLSLMTSVVTILCLLIFNMQK